jgi:hypothetical protein
VLSSTLIPFAAPPGNSVLVKVAGHGLQHWDLDKGTITRELGNTPGRIVATGFDSTTPEVLIRVAGGALYRWNYFTGERTEVAIPAIPDDYTLAGWSPDGLVVLASESEVEVWDTHTGVRTEFTTPGSTHVWNLVGNTLIGLSDNGPLHIDLDRDDIQQRLCAISDRDYTDAERAELPKGVYAGPPCRNG